MKSCTARVVLAVCGIALLGAALLSGCGKKGPLYLPEDKPGATSVRSAG